MVGVDRLEGIVLGLEPDAAALLEEPLDRRLLRHLVLADERHDDVAVLGGLLPANHDEIAFEDPRIDHRVALDAQEELLAPARKRLRDAEVVLDVLLDRKPYAEASAAAWAAVETGISEGMLAFARKAIEGSDNVALVRTDGVSLRPLASGSFDLVLCNAVYQHVFDSYWDDGRSVYDQVA